MSSDPIMTAEISLAVTEEERAMLADMLENALGETRVEAHHTDNPTYLETVRHREVLLRGLLDKVLLCARS